MRIRISLHSKIPHLSEALAHDDGRLSLRTFACWSQGYSKLTLEAAAPRWRRSFSLPSSKKAFPMRQPPNPNTSAHYSNLFQQDAPWWSFVGHRTLRRRRPSARRGRWCARRLKDIASLHSPVLTSRRLVCPGTYCLRAFVASRCHCQPNATPALSQQTQAQHKNARSMALP